MYQLEIKVKLRGETNSRSTCCTQPFAFYHDIMPDFRSIDILILIDRDQNCRHQLASSAYPWQETLILLIHLFGLILYPIIVRCWNTPSMIGASALSALLAGLLLVEAVPTQKVFSNIGPIVNTVDPLKR
jgi:hypothetical protein